MRSTLAVIAKTYSAQGAVTNDDGAWVPTHGSRGIAIVLNVTAVGGTPTMNVRLVGRSEVSTNGAAYTPTVEVRLDKTSKNGAAGTSGADQVVSGAVAASETYAGYVSNCPFEWVTARTTVAGTTPSVTATISIAVAGSTY